MTAESDARQDVLDAVERLRGPASLLPSVRVQRQYEFERLLDVFVEAATSQDGYDDGYSDGKSDGEREGGEAGYARGYDQGKAEGSRLGDEEGYERGYRTGFDAAERGRN
jgi:flagellar biosynthesis/type III secretory pathway protein FliH